MFKTPFQRKMVIEFVTWMNPNNFPANQVIPEVYNEEALHGNSTIYIISSKGYRYKVELKRPHEGLWYLRGEKWKEFCECSLNKDVALLHFIEEGEDTFYVTGYYRNGSEVGGYERRRDTFKRFMTRVLPDPTIIKYMPAEFLPKLNELDEIDIEIEELMFKCNVRRVEVPLNPDHHEYRFLGDTWSRLVEDVGLETGMICVFTKNGDKQLLLNVFHNDGSMFTNVKFKGATTLKMQQMKLTYFEQQDDRMLHVCQWPFHMDHFGECDTFYKRYALIQDKNRLAIPARFMKNHPMHSYSKAMIIHKDHKFFMTMRMENHQETPNRNNHVNMYGQWKSLALVCNFNFSKMIRFRLMSVGLDLDSADGEGGEFPIFHIC